MFSRAVTVYRAPLRSPEAAFKRRLIGVLEHPEPPTGYATDTILYALLARYATVYTRVCVNR